MRASETSNIECCAKLNCYPRLGDYDYKCFDTPRVYNKIIKSIDDTVRKLRKSTSLSNLFISSLMLQNVHIR